MAQDLGTNYADDFKLVIVSDGTTTTAQLLIRDATDPFSPYFSIGAGTAKRRKGETRNFRLGQQLAAVRAMKAAVEYLSKGLEEYL